MYVASQSTVCEWHQFQGLNEVIYSPYRQFFRACGGLRGNLITPSRTRPPVGARLKVPTHCIHGRFTLHTTELITNYLAHTLLGIPYDEVNVENSYPVPGTKTPGVQPGHMLRDTVQYCNRGACVRLCSGGFGPATYR